ncbi:MBL fold metallo-hydrolase [Tenggerimyces flavus]|uniref:MBL fold metallo-hydrolase n=1 Tax=Tenggerimyces flavus TaxID=1708749 RepID=A0ABV7YBW2_9ACTN|nr:MBL fold metallo-hydrolase [Tenggerimyces flavus]MBM7785589.1 glyoxylase-like metal-dependent hydrolase (beta-lactamase superfamily II) [Tenggerimyces flavus]
MAVERRAFGDVVVSALVDGTGPFFEDLSSAFPSAGLAGVWELDFRCFALRLADGRSVLVDAGIGPSVAGAETWTPVPGRLPALLSEISLAPGDVSAVVLTHLHSDHVGWAVVDSAPYFPNARYVLQRSEFETVGSRVVSPLFSSGLLDLVDGRSLVAPGVEVVPTPGHTPGHQSVLVGEGLVVTGDVLVHEVQLADPEVAYAYESDPELARFTRLELLADARSRGALLATSHLREAFVLA